MEDEYYDEDNAYQEQSDFELHKALEVIDAADESTSVGELVKKLRKHAPIHAKTEVDALELLIELAQTPRAKQLAGDARVKYQQLQQQAEEKRFSSYVSYD